MIAHEAGQGTDEWYKARYGKPSASNAKKLVTSKGGPSKSLKGYAVELAADRFAGKNVDSFEGNAWTERGNELEDSARSLYELVNDCTVVESGFITDDKEQYGASPDGLINDDGLVEFKCLKASNHISAIMYHKKHGKPPTDYIAQVQMQMFVIGRTWTDLMFFHPDLPELIIRIEPDLDFHKVLESQLAEVIKERDRIVGILNAV